MTAITRRFEQLSPQQVWLLLVVMLLLWRIPYYGKFLLDDPFITFRHASNLIQHGQFTYNLNQYVQATTTPVYGLTAAVFELLGISVRWGALVFNLGCEIVLLYVLGQIINLITDTHQWLALGITGILMLTNRAFSIASTSGMETALFVLLNMTTLLYLMRRRYIIATVVGSLATLTRPDGIFVLVVLGLTIMIYERRLPFQEVGLSLLIAAPWLLVATLTYGQPIAQSVLAKGGSVDLSQNPYLLRNLRVVFYEPLRFFGIAALLPLIVGFRQLWLARTRMLPLLLFTVAHLCYVVLPYNTGFEWYFAPLFAVFNIMIGIGIVKLLANGFRWVGQVSLAVLAIGIVYSSIGNYISVNTFDKIWRDGMFRAIDYLNAQAPADAVIQTTSIGVIGYYTEFQILDSLGLASPEITPLFQQVSDFPALFRLVATTFQPDYIVSFGPEDYANYSQVADFPTSDVAIIIYRREDS